MRALYYKTECTRSMVTVGLKPMRTSTAALHSLALTYCLKLTAMLSIQSKFNLSRSSWTRELFADPTMLSLRLMQVLFQPVLNCCSSIIRLRCWTACDFLRSNLANKVLWTQHKYTIDIIMHLRPPAIHSQIHQNKVAKNPQKIFLLE